MRLSVQKQIIVKFAAEGLSNKEIAAKLNMTVRAVRWHFERLYHSCGLYGQGSRLYLLKFLNHIGVIKL